MPPSSSALSPASSSSPPCRNHQHQQQLQLVCARPSSPPPRKFRSMEEIMKMAKFAVVAREDYSDVTCDQCGSGENDYQLLLCDKCDKAFHMSCLRPIVVLVPIGPWYCPKCSDPPHTKTKKLSQKKIYDFFGIQKKRAAGLSPGKQVGKRISPQGSFQLVDSRKRRRRSSTLVLHKKRRRRILPFTPTEDTERRLEQMGSLALALTASKMEFSGVLTYPPNMAPRSANQAKFENGGMQVLPKKDRETVEYCRTMYARGECPPLRVVFDSCEGYTVEADGPIKDMTFLAEYTGDVDYIMNRENDDCDSMMTLLLSSDPSKSLVICPDKRGNIARFISGINNHTPEGKKKENVKCVRYSVNGECRVFLVATRDIAAGERLYYDYNGYEHEYPTYHFV